MLNVLNAYRIYGFIVNYLPFALCAVIAGRLTGWSLAALGIRLTELRLNGLHLPHSPVLTGLLAIGRCACCWPSVRSATGG